MPDPFILNLAPTGLIPTKATNPSVPITPAEIAEQVLECIELGLSMVHGPWSMVHLHARDPQTSQHSPDKADYARIIAEIRRHAPQMVICVATSGREVPEGTFWSCGGMGHSQLAANTIALACGGGVRVGLEDNLWMDKTRTTLATNKQLVKRVLESAALLGRRPYQAQNCEPCSGCRHVASRTHGGPPMSKRHF